MNFPKKYWALIFCPCIYLSVAAQDVEHLFSEQPYMRHYDVVRVAGKTYVSGSMKPCKEAVVSILDENNELLTHAPVNAGEVLGEEYWEVDDLVYYEEGNFLLGAGEFRQTFDVAGSPFDGPYVFGMDLEGNILFKTHTVYPSYGNAAYLDYSYSGGFIWVVGELGMAWLDFSGEVLDTVILDTFFPVKGVRKAGEALYAYSDTKLLRTDAVGQWEEVFAGAFANNILGMEVDDIGERLFFLMDNGELLYTSYTNMDGVFEVAGDFSSGSPTGMTGNSGHLFLYDGNVGQVTQVNKGDFTMVATFDFSDSPAPAKGLRATEDDLFLFGDAWPATSFIKSIPIGDALTWEDYSISVSNPVLLDGYYNVSDSTSMGNGEFIYILTPTPVTYSFDLHNNGNHPIHDLTVQGSNGLPPGIGSCANSVFHTPVTGLDILPGQTVTVTVQSDNEPVVFGESSTPVVLPKLVFAPNNRFDMDGGNASFSISIPVISTSTHDVADVGNWQVFPNPAKGDFYIKSMEGQAFSWRLYDLLGKPVKWGVSNRQNLLHIPAEDVAAGIYILSLSNERGSHAVRVRIAGR